MPMEVKTDKKANATTLKTCRDNSNASTTDRANADDRLKCSGATSEDFLIFGARPSQLFDEISLALDTLLTEEVASLPLLPRTLTEASPQQSNEGGGHARPQTGEDKILGKLRRAYQKNLDLAEAYCARNIFTVQNHPKTLRRKILEQYLAQDTEENDKTEKKGGNRNTPPTPLPITTLPPPEGDLPSPEQITGMDQEILVARQRLQHAKRRRIQLKCQLDRLDKASEPLMGVREALTHRVGVETNGKGEGMAASVHTLQQMVSRAMEGHHELRGWNSRAEEVLQILDKIKVKRAEKNHPPGTTIEGHVKKVGGREADERERKRMWTEACGTAASHGSKEQVASLLKKIRGK